MLVTSSDADPTIGDIEMITDGDKAGADGSYVEIAPGVQHVTIDLEEEYEIYAILFWYYHKQARVYSDVIVQVADDPDFIVNVRTLFNAKGNHARFVHLYSNGSSASENNHYVEVESFGKPAE